MKAEPRLKHAEKIIAGLKGLEIEEIYSQKRNKELVEARYVLWLIAMASLGCTSVALAKIYNRDHTSILTGVKKAKENELLSALADEIASRIL